MRLGFITTSFRSYQWYSGISNALYLLAKGLDEKYGIYPTIYAPVSNLPTKKDENKHFSVKRFKIVHAGSHYKISLDAFRQVSEEKLDLMHSFHYGYFPATVGINQARSKGIPHAFTTAYHSPASPISKSLMKVYNFVQGSYILKNSDVVMPFNNDERSKLESISGGKYRVVPCPIDNKIFRPKQKSGKLTVAFVGAMEPWKGPHIAFDIFKQIEKERHDVEFIIVGNGPYKHQVSLYQKLKKVGGKRFTFMRELSAQELSGVYKKADILVAPTLYESFGCILAESMMCGTPVVSTQVGAVPETVGNGGMLVNYGEWAKMKGLVTELLDDDKLRRRLSKNALVHSRQYSDDIVVKKVHKIYKELC